MRLIDAEKCPCTKCGSMDDYCQHTCGMLKEWLNTTAYDVEKVVEELYHNKQDYRGDGTWVIDVLNYWKAVDIVKRGGINDNNR